MSQHGRLVNVKFSSSYNHSADDNLTRKTIQQQILFYIFKGEAKVNVNVIVYTNVNGPIKDNTKKEKDFLQAHVTRH